MRGVALADTGPLYAVGDPTDSLHERALEEQKRLEVEGLNVVVSYATLQETHGLVLRKLGLVQAKTLLRELVRTTFFLVPAEEDHRRAIRRVLRYPDQDISLADAINAEISDRIGAPVWTYDHHFDIMGARVWQP